MYIPPAIPERSIVMVEQKAMEVTRSVNAREPLQVAQSQAHVPPEPLQWVGQDGDVVRISRAAQGIGPEGITTPDPMDREYNAMGNRVSISWSVLSLSEMATASVDSINDSWNI